MTSEIRRDLDRRINHRLGEWMHDAVQLYEIGEISADQTMLDISGALMMALVTCLACSSATPETIGEAVGDAMQRAVAYKRKHMAEKAESQES